MKRIVTLALVALLGVTSYAQEASAPRLDYSVSEHHSINSGSTAYEFGLGYRIGNVCVLRLNYGQVEFLADTFHQETLTFTPAVKQCGFSLIPEVSLGLLHGKSDASKVYGQFQWGVSLNYSFSRSTSCGLTAKSIQFDNNVIPSVGIYYRVYIL